MKDVYAVLLQKEKDLQRVWREIEALRLVIPLLSEEPGQSPQAVDESASTAPQANDWPIEVREAR
jgi:hypothetical protein